MTMLITGGAGFIGSNFIYYIMKKYPDRRADFSEGLERTVRWYLESGDWWRPLWEGGTV